ncbi:hypothetical protein BCV72DRAFT_116251 [Rhizopus microsporus var. microsporus]|uniref:Uncharacterized protein n=1 Tax=Rhizopus microsporus var. microsporus TaxID=86635 RepID=A0A1X0R4V8_RHIZD|nr:hypothetical protein BCV72DRAFT_116251 [Rhizopus microsporus var. microsporus]
MKISALILFAVGTFLLNSNVVEAQKKKSTCWNSCFARETACPAGFEPKTRMIGLCWSCCRL